MHTIQFDNAEFLPYVCELANEGKDVTIKAKGNSMRPFVESERDEVVLCKVGNVKIGDVVLAEITPGHFVLHRIDAISGDKVRMRGDGNVGQVEYCHLSDIKAAASRFIRKGKSYSLEGKIWKTYSWFWVRLIPVRRYLLSLYRLLWLGQVPVKIKRLFGRSRK